MMSKSMKYGVAMVAVAAAFAGGAAWAGEKATKDEAVAMVKKGVASIKTNGADKTYAEIIAKSPEFKVNDLYLVVYGLDGTVKAHGSNAKMVGKALIGLRDIDGKEFVKERVELAKSKGSFWQDYKFTNPTTKKIQPKAMYCERLEETVVCGGIYK